ncbi:LysR substrate-binding domain-containing protein [Oricola thermophila]|uniref:LysR family transcriptional regulator n=1 Tax=Oricola thermophila TaxID=2742145 RepID=A0A6N1V8J5_9HYPH|nr:LysR substrate-binding domain-containing protein [Oricola thermophila]QKV17244.1 LysR family transcriptional regulator [Oricola thermophila]
MKERRIRFRHIRTFLEVARQRNATRAAERLNTVQPAVSRSLRELETEIGRPLFERTSDGLVLTEAGERLYHFANTGMSHIEMGVAEAAGDGHHEVVSFGALPNITRRILPEAVLRFKRVRPGIIVRLLSGTNEELLGKLRTGEVDFVIGRLAGPETMTGLSFEHLLYENMVFAARAGHPLADLDLVPLSSVDRHLVILPPPKTVIRQELDKFLVANGIPRFRDSIETISFEFAKLIVRDSDAVVALPFGAMEPELADGTLVQLATPSETLRGPVGLTFLPGRQLSPPTLMLLEILRDRISRLAGANTV